VPRRRAHADLAAGHRGAVAGDPARAEGPVRVRREARSDGREPSGAAGHAARRRDDHHERASARGARRDRRPASPAPGQQGGSPGEMNPELYIRRPVLTTLLMAAILIFGIMAYRLLPVSDLPNVDFPTIQVQATL